MQRGTRSSWRAKLWEIVYWEPQCPVIRVGRTLALPEHRWPRRASVHARDSPMGMHCFGWITIHVTLYHVVVRELFSEHREEKATRQSSRSSICVVTSNLFRSGTIYSNCKKDLVTLVPDTTGALLKSCSDFRNRYLAGLVALATFRPVSEK